MHDWPPTARSQSRPTARGWLATARASPQWTSGASPQGRPAPLAEVVARRGDAYGHDRLRPARKGNSGHDGGIDGARGVRASF
ncbi:hypothetical protein B296_00010644 [Ensete ventricosum]|uniref:Uncharacterized protein n=1 Tax=Ensete ventricosum TaxID=4639 RepID=A0A427ATJ1_ENSVE|nr:hypothetical protein B296_00010644 [Ensete ventricosum]